MKNLIIQRKKENAEIPMISISDVDVNLKDLFILTRNKDYLRSIVEKKVGRYHANKKLRDKQIVQK